MTFDEARQKSVAELRVACDDLIRISSDEKWCNVEYRDFKDSMKRIYEICEDIARLNGVEVTVGRYQNHA